MIWIKETSYNYLLNETKIQEAAIQFWLLMYNMFYNFSSYYYRYTIILIHAEKLKFFLRTDPCESPLSTALISFRIVSTTLRDSDKERCSQGEKERIEHKLKER